MLEAQKSAILAERFAQSPSKGKSKPVRKNKERKVRRYIFEGEEEEPINIKNRGAII